MESYNALVPEADIRAYARCLFSRAERVEEHPGRRKLQLVDAFLSGAASTGAFTLDELRRLL